MKLNTILVALVIVGVAYSFSFGSIGNVFKKAVSTVSNVAKTSVNTVQKAGNTAVNQVAKTANTAANQVVKTTNTAVNQVVNTANQVAAGALHAFKQVKNVGLLVAKGSQSTFFKAKNLGVNFGNDMKSIANKIGKTLDPRQISLNDLKTVLKGVQMATGPMAEIMDNPLVDTIMSNSPLAEEYAMVKVAVKIINDPEHAHIYLMNMNPLGAIVGQIVMSTIQDPNNWQTHLMTAVPQMAQVAIALDTAKSGKVPQIDPQLVAAALPQ